MEKPKGLPKYFKLNVSHFLTLRGIQWASKNGYKLSARYFSEVSALGDLELLNWLRDHGCPRDDRIWWRAIENGDLKTLRWLKSKYSWWDIPDDSCTFNYVHPRGVKWLKIQKYLRRN